MNDFQQYCVVATDKATLIREDISGPMSKGLAENERQRLYEGRVNRKYWRYFRVAKYPYRKRKEGSK